MYFKINFWFVGLKKRLPQVCINLGNYYECMVFVIYVLIRVLIMKEYKTLSRVS